MASDTPVDAPSAAPSCTRFADALYFCYSPVWQVTELYRQGRLDDCKGKWGELYDCLSLRARPNAELQARLAERAAMPCMWRERTPEQAAAFWRTEFAKHADAE